MKGGQARTVRFCVLLVLTQGVSAITVTAPASSAAPRFYTLGDFARVDKIDGHVHVHGVADRFMVQAIADDFRILTINVDYPGFPAAVVLPPVLKTADYEDTATNLRSYEWYVLVLANPDDIPKSDPTFLAGLEDNVCAVFDGDCTLQGTANGAVMPAVMEPPGPVNYNSVTYVVFYLSFVARVLVPAGVQ